MPTKVQMWQADDGKFFDTEDDAVGYEQYLGLMQTMRDSVWCRDISVEDVAEWLYCNYDMTERLKLRTLPK